MLHSDHSIHRLPSHLINQIKAGEVIERTSFLLKEILENAIDAGASFCELTLVNDGLDLIVLKDNGKGMSFEDLPLAFERHATSKITQFDDLYQLNSFGFRGEALASIAAIARVECESTPSQGSGGKIIFEGDQKLAHFPLTATAGQTPGTRMVIKNLFFNTPVRLKFIKSKTSEKNAIRRVLNSFLLAYPEVTFKICWDQKHFKTYSCGMEHFPQRLVDIFKLKADEVKNFLYFEKHHEAHRVVGYLYPTPLKSQKKNQYLLVNRRLVEDTTLHRSIYYPAQKIWGEGQSGAYFFNIETPKDKIDVNVHPNKIHIKFQNTAYIQSLITSVIKDHCTLPKREVHAPRAHTPPSFQSKTDESFHFRSYGQELESESQLHAGEWEFIHSIDENYFLLKNHIKQEYSILLARPFLLFYLNRELSSISEPHAVPLLISEPLAFELGPREEQLIEHLASFGLEIDRLDRNTLALRALPSALELISYAPLLQNYMHLNRDRFFPLTPIHHHLLEGCSAPPRDLVTRYLEALPAHQANSWLIPLNSDTLKQWH